MSSTDGPTEWFTVPDTRDGVLVVAFEGWNDAGDAASGAVRYIRDHTNSSLFAQIDPEEFYDFTTVRPLIGLVDGKRELHWPQNEFFHASLAEGPHDVVSLVGIEPQLRWRSFCDQVLDVVERLHISTVVTAGALLADVPHSRPVPVYGTTYDAGSADRLGLEQSQYEGPTGIVGVLHDRCRLAGLSTASFWAAVPAYVPASPSAKAALALVERISTTLEVTIDTTELEIGAAAYNREVDQLVLEDDDTGEYVRQLEEAHDLETPSADALMDEVERFLRSQE